jgi:uncharacterized protein YmfQ (DUF2313 family)
MYPYPPPTATPEDYLTQFQRLLPRGNIWHRGWGWMQDADLLTLMPMWARLQLRLNDLIAQIFPCSTTELLPEWEATLGLPDPCIGPLSTLQQRTAAVCAKFTARGGQSREYFIHLAASAGLTIEIEEFRPFEASVSHAGDPLYDEAWAYAWRIIVQAQPVIYWFRASESAAQEPLATWGDQTLQCLLQRYAPANTVLIFAYRIDSSIWDNGTSPWDSGDSIWDQNAIWDPNE